MCYGNQVKGAIAMNLSHWLLLIFLAVIFTIALTFASMELPRLLHSRLQFEHPDGDSHADDLSAFKRELFIDHYNIRLIGYASFILIILLIAVGFITKKIRLASLGAFALFLPVFAQFAGVMFFLAGLGILNLIWMPMLDISFDILSLGDIVYIPYRVLMYIGSLFRLDIYELIAYGLIGLGLLVFMLGTLAWLYARFQKKDIADFWLYRISRHPQYLGWIIWSYGLLIYLIRMPYPKRSWGIPSSLPWLLSSMVIVGVALMEELKMRQVTGEEYELYLRQTPFMIPLPRFASKIIAFPMRLIIRKKRPEKRWEVVATIALYTAILILLSVVSLGFTKLLKTGELIPSFDKEKRAYELIESYKQEKNRLVKFSIYSSLAEMNIY
jgi:protein-S-isoprenylcysteine O-methyltransferase Ste14